MKWFLKRVNSAVVWVRAIWRREIETFPAYGCTDKVYWIERRK